MSASTPFDFTNYRVVVCGGSKGIGRSIALAFAQSGAAVSLCARGQDGLDEVTRAIGALGATVHTQSCDVADPEALNDYIASAAQALGGIDVLINNASAFGFEDDEAGWAAGINVDLLAAVRASRAALPHLRRSGHGCILHTTSISAYHALPHAAPYAAIKAAIAQYTTSQALTLAKDRVRVNAIAPGSILFPGGKWERCQEERRELFDATLAGIPFGRFGTPDEIAPVALFLASPLACWITGQTIVVDGGQTLA